MVFTRRKKKKGNKTPEMVTMKRAGCSGGFWNRKHSCCCTGFVCIATDWSHGTVEMVKTHLHLYLKKILWVFFFPWEHVLSSGGLFSDLGWGGSFNGLEEEDVATLDSSVVCGVNFSSNRPEFSGLPPAHSWIVYILLKKKSNLCIFYIIYR